MINDEQMKRMLMMFDDSSIKSRSGFVLKCAVEGLKLSDEDYNEMLKYEASQLQNIAKVKDLFDGTNDEEAILLFKTKYHLVLSAGKKTDNQTLRNVFSVEAIDGNRIKPFNASMDLMEDMQSMHGIDVDAELWNLLKFEALSRN